MMLLAENDKDKDVPTQGVSFPSGVATGRI